MKRIIEKVLLLLLFSALPLQALTQQMSLREQRQFKLSALRLIEDYETSSALSDYESMADFIGLFDNDAMLIYNDLLGFSDEPKISVRDYANIFRSNGRTSKIVIKNLRKSEIYTDNISWLIDVYFDKELDYTDDCGTLLSSDAYFGADHSIKAVIAKDMLDGRIYIKSLEGSINSEKSLLNPNYAVVKKSSSKYESSVLCNGRPLDFNKFDQAIVPANPKFEFRDVDVNMSVIKETSECEVYSLKFKPRRWRIKPRVGMGWGLKLEHGASNLTDKSSSLDFGLEIGYALPLSSKVKLGFFVGGAFSKTNLDLCMEGYNYNYAASEWADMDGDTYRRYYELSNIKQTIKINSVMIPVYLDLDFSLSRSVSMYIQAGVNGYLNLDAKSDFSANSYVYGIYPQYEDLRLEETWLNAFGQNTLTSSNLTSDKVEVKKFTLDAFAGLGFRFKLFGPVMLDVGAGYQMGITNILQTPNVAASLTSSTPSEQSALVSYSVYGGEQVHNMTDAFDGIKRQCIRANAGLIIKF